MKLLLPALFATLLFLGGCIQNLKENTVEIVNETGSDFAFYISAKRYDVAAGSTRKIKGLDQGRHPYGSKFPSTIVVGGEDEVLHVGSGLSGLVDFSSQGQKFYIEYMIGVEIEKGEPAKVDGNGDVITEAVPDKRKYTVNAITSQGWVD